MRAPAPSTMAGDARTPAPECKKEARGHRSERPGKEISSSSLAHAASPSALPVDTKGDDLLYVVCTPSAADDACALGLNTIALP